ncbi:hypothetical protein B0H17DRAFT_1207525 [Mycena rosella]|uniref:Uncharacterized protein n=1 Tax=Mycena rosella TaxID=1033263 RepID=A0AAD7D2P9_MYCRO|nr:hypothetical protein B0H17DRAFT_1207525 [Mycena rosella]
MEQLPCRWHASDRAWFAIGASDNGQHHPLVDGFFSDFDTLHDSFPANETGHAARKAFGEDIQRLIFDLATLWDRTFGSTTLIMHCEGTTIPGSLARPEYLCCAHTFRRIVFAPTPTLMHPSLRSSKASSRTWTLSQPHPMARPNHMRLEPSSLPTNVSSAHYVFRGRPTLPAPVPVAAAAPIAVAAPATPTEFSDDTDFSSDAIALIAAIEQIATLETEVGDILERHGEELRENEANEIQLNTQLNEANKIQLNTQLNESLACERGYQEQLGELRDFVSDLHVQLDSAIKAKEAVERIRPPSSPAPSSPLCLRPPRTPSRHAPNTALGEEAHEVLLHRTTTFLSDHHLDVYTTGIQTMVRHVAATRWYKELAVMGVGADLVPELLACLTEDLDE